MVAYKNELLPKKKTNLPTRTAPNTYKNGLSRRGANGSGRRSRWRQRQHMVLGPCTWRKKIQEVTRTLTAKSIEPMFACFLCYWRNQPNTLRTKIDVPYVPALTCRQAGSHFKLDLLPPHFAPLHTNRTKHRLFLPIHKNLTDLPVSVASAATKRQFQRAVVGLWRPASADLLTIQTEYLYATATAR